MEILVERTDGYSGADMNTVTREAALAPMKDLICLDEIETIDNLPPIEFKHFILALKSVKPSVAKHEIDRYIKFTQQFGC